MSEVKNIPILRFSEFNEIWSQFKLKDVSKYSNGGSFENDVNEYGRYELVTLKSINTQGKLVSSGRYIDKDVKTLKKGTLVMILSEQAPGLLGMTAIIPCDNKYVLNQRVAEIRPTNEINNFFLSSVINVNQRYFSKQGAGMKVQNISKPNVEKFEFYIPSLPEQQKIADFLTAVDKRIELLEKKKTLLETYKKGVMKKIFNQEIRFKDDNGNDFPDWEEKRLGDIGEFKTSSVDKKLDDNEQEVFLVNYMNVYRHEKITNENKHDLMVVTAKPNQIDSNNLLKGDILFTPSSETPDDIGHSVVIFEDLDDTLYSYHLLRFRPTIKIDILYSHYFCNNDLVLNQICRFATGSTRFTISKDSFSKILINLPCVEEQSKIARFLDSIDKQLELLESQIDKSKTWKKGLLQKMFV